MTIRTRLSGRVDAAFAWWWAPKIARVQARGMHAWRDGARMVVRDPRFDEKPQQWHEEKAA